MARKNDDLVFKAQRLFQEANDMSRRLEDQLREEFLEYVRGIRAREINSASKRALANEVMATAKMVVDALINDNSETGKK